MLIFGLCFVLYIFEIDGWYWYFYLTGEATGQPSARVPYNQGGFQVTGLPDGVEFIKPTGYGSNTIQAIMKNSENIKFSIVPNQISDRDQQATVNANIPKH